MSQTPELVPGPRHRDTAQYAISTALFDVDNTLVSNDSSDLPSERFRTAAQAAQGRLSIGLASARPLSKVAHILDSIKAEGLSILCNGAQIIKNGDRSVVAEWPIANKTCTDIARELRELGVVFWINDDGVDYFPSDKANDTWERQSDIWSRQSQRLPAPDYWPSKPFVINAHDISDKQADHIEHVVASYGDPNITSLISHEIRQPDGSMLYDLFVVHKHANKQDALTELARIQDVDLSNLMAVGDGRNDAVLVGSAGVGVAMGNSAKETLAVASFIAPNREDDGAAVALEHALDNFTYKK